MGRSKAHGGGRISYATILCQRPRCPSAVLTVGRCANGTGSSEHYGSGRIDQRLGAGSRQTFCNGPHWDYHPINGDRGVDASKLHPKSKIWEGCPCEDARGSPPHKCIHMSRRYKETPQFRLEPLSNRLVGEIEEGCGICVSLSNIPAQFTGSFVFQALYGDGQIRLRSSIRPSEPLCPRRQQPILAGTSVGCWCYRYDWAGDYVSPRQCLRDRTAEVYGLAVATAAGGGAFTLAGPGVSSAGTGIVSERTNRAVFVAHIALERADEVVYNPWIGCTGVVREAYQFVRSTNFSKRTTSSKKGHLPKMLA